MKRNVLLIAHFCDDFDGKGNNRFNYLADLLVSNGYNVELISTSYSHTKKERRSNNHYNVNYKVTLISEPGYKKNVSLKRFYSHYIMSRNLDKYLKTIKIPDIIYCAVPSLDVAKVAAQYSCKNNVPFIIDIQDLWPEGFRLVFNLPMVSDFLFLPMKLKANYIYSRADAIVAVSKTYANRALKANKKCYKGHSIFLGTDLNNFDNLAIKNQIYKQNDEIWLTYVGTLGHSYDLTCVLDALRLLKDKGINNIKFIVLGDGPLKEKFRDYAKKLKLNVDFKGRLDYGKMVGVLVASDIAINPISHNAAQSIINKHGDYAAAGLPVLNTQECKEYRDLVDEYKMGLNCENNNSKDLADKMLILYNNNEIRKKMSVNSRKLAEDKFNREQTYQEIVNLINRL